jgi:hypothetical protein
VKKRHRKRRNFGAIFEKRYFHYALLLIPILILTLHIREINKRYSWMEDVPL